LARLSQETGVQIPVDEALPIGGTRSTAYYDGNEHGGEHHLPGDGPISV
jgi:hypothetical protein